MTQLSGPEIKHSLRKLEYPICVREALIKIGSLMCGRTPTLKQMDLALDLMAELVFCEVDRRGIKRQKYLSQLNELQLLEVLFEYFNQNGNEPNRNAIFLSLFSGTTATMRSSVLCKLVSIAIAAPSAPILLSSSAWMQQLGNTSANSNSLANAIITDYFLLSKCSHKLDLLPTVAPQFTANFLTAVANMYFLDYKDSDVNIPPECLVNTITEWIKQNTKLCLAAQEYPCILPPGAITMEVTTPIAGFIRWCTLAPIANQNTDMYAQLYLGLLNTVSEISVADTPREIAVQSLNKIVEIIVMYVQDIKGKLKQSDPHTNLEILLTHNAALQLALDRFAQIIQVALSVNSIYGNVGDLLKYLQQLPKNRLFDIVIQLHQHHSDV